MTLPPNPQQRQGVGNRGRRGPQGFRFGKGIYPWLHPRGRCLTGVAGLMVPGRPGQHFRAGCSCTRFAERLRDKGIREVLPSASLTGKGVGDGAWLLGHAGLFLHNHLRSYPMNLWAWDPSTCCSGHPRFQSGLGLAQPRSPGWGSWGWGCQEVRGRG